MVKKGRIFGFVGDEVICPECKHTTVQRIINTTLVLPPEMAVTKTNLRSAKVGIISADWGKSWLYCQNCGWNSKCIEEQQSVQAS